MLTAGQQSQFLEQGYVVVPRFNEIELLESALARFEGLFSGEFETGIQPDEWNWRDGLSPLDHTRQICNGWKSDRAIARLVLNEKVGQICAQLMNWPGTRINQDNVIWKPAGALPLGFHQDDAYQDWIEPPTMVTCWMALDTTSEEGGTIEYVRGSNHWPVEYTRFPFHAPEDYHQGLRSATQQLGVDNYIVHRLEVEPGDVVFHHGRTWHGSGANLTQNPRRSVVSHCMSSESRFHAEKVSPIYGRYKRFGSTEMDESFFPVIYSHSGYRSTFLAGFLSN